MLPKVEDAPLLPKSLQALIDQLHRILYPMCYRLNRTPEHGKVDVNPDSINAGVQAATDVTVDGLLEGDSVMANPLGTLEAGLIFNGAYVPADNTLRILLYNATGAPIDGAELEWVWVKLD